MLNILLGSGWFGGNGLQKDLKTRSSTLLQIHCKFIAHFYHLAFFTFQAQTGRFAFDLVLDTAAR